MPAMKKKKKKEQREKSWILINDFGNKSKQEKKN